MFLKKPKFWDSERPDLFSYLLYPFCLVTKISNSLSDLKKKKKFKIKTICIGNIYLGGTGKTSLCIKLKDLLEKKGKTVCFIKKYHRNQKDEIKLLEKFGKVYSGNDRKNSLLSAYDDNYEYAILDDGLHENIEYDTTIVCFNSINWIGNGMIIPAGPLRENIKEIRKYDIVFINGNKFNIEPYKKYFDKHQKNIELFHAKYNQTNIEDFDKDLKYLVFSGIGNHQTFLEMLEENKFNIVNNIEYPDHYEYSKKDLQKIISIAEKNNLQIITTEKDLLRIEESFRKEFKTIKVDLIIKNENKFLEKLKIQ